MHNRFVSLLSVTMLMVTMNASAEFKLTRSTVDLPSITDKSYPNSRVGPRVLFPEPRSQHLPERPFEDQGRWLLEHGISLHLSFDQLYMRNPSFGLETGKETTVSIFALGADLDMNKIAGLDGGVLHFQQIYAPWVSNNEFGLQAGDAIIGKPAPFIPKVNHLTLFTYEQRLLDNKLSIEVGKSNAGNYFALPLCNVPIGCINAILLDTAGFNPPPYSNWSARTSYDFTPALRVQLGAWRTNNAYPFTNGWERHEGDSGGTLSTTYLANAVYRTDFSMEPYPQTYEIMGFHNNGEQIDPYYTVDHTSKVTSTAAVHTSNDVSGFYLGAKKTFWRNDSGLTDTLTPTALSAYANLTHTFDKDVTNGVKTVGQTGLILSAPWHSRPFDSYGLSFKWAQLTDREQKFLEDTHRVASNGGEYKPGRNEYAVIVDANFIASKGIIISPFMMRSWGASSLLNPFSENNPSDGYAFGVLLHIQIDHLLGLNGIK